MNKYSDFRGARLGAEDKLRLVSYGFAVAWPLVFLTFPPTSYSMVNGVIVLIWMVGAAVGGIGAIVGVLTGIDLKIELPSLYVVLTGPLLYFVAQIGLIMAGEFQNRIALAVFVLWHIALMGPRIIGLEKFRRRERVRRKADL